jgi:hypothetical protein
MIVLQTTGLQAERNVFRFWGYRQGRKKRGQKDFRLPALPYSLSAALESLLSVALRAASARASRLYHFAFPIGTGRFFD